MTTAADKEPAEEDSLGPAHLLAADSASMCHVPSCFAVFLALSLVRGTGTRR